MRTEIPPPRRSLRVHAEGPRRAWALGLALLAMVGCGAGDGAGEGSAETTPAPDDSTSLARDVFPIVQQYGCASVGCHDDPERSVTHYADLRTPESVYLSWVGSLGGMLGFDHCDPSGEPKGNAVPSLDHRRVEPGEPDESLVIRKVEETRDVCDPFFGRMPPFPRERMAPADIAVIRKWIAEGALDN